MRLPKNRRPTTPGEVFLEEFLEPLGITQKDAAARLRNASVGKPRSRRDGQGKEWEFRGWSRKPVHEAQESSIAWYNTCAIGGQAPPPDPHEEHNGF